MLAVCAATELNPRYGRLYAYLQDDVTRKLPSPRLVGQLLEGEGLSPADVMAAFDAGGRLRHLGALKLLGDAQTPLAERPVKVADRLAAVLLGGRMDESAQSARLRMIDTPVHDPGRGEAVATMTALLERPSHLPIVLAGPDADSLLSHGLRTPARRRARARPRRPRRDVRGGADHRARGPPGDLRRARGHRARRPRAAAARDRAAPGAHRAGRADAHRRARARRAHRAARRGRLAVLRRARARPGPTSPARPRPATSPRSSGSR